MRAHGCHRRAPARHGMSHRRSILVSVPIEFTANPGHRQEAARAALAGASRIRISALPFRWTASHPPPRRGTVAPHSGHSHGSFDVAASRSMRSEPMNGRYDDGHHVNDQPTSGWPCGGDVSRRRSALGGAGRSTAADRMGLRTGQVEARRQGAHNPNGARVQRAPLVVLGPAKPGRGRPTAQGRPPWGTYRTGWSAGRCRAA